MGLGCGPFLFEGSELTLLMRGLLDTGVEGLEFPFEDEGVDAVEFTFWLRGFHEVEPEGAKLTFGVGGLQFKGV